MLRGGIVKDDSGAYAVIADQGSSGEILKIQWFFLNGIFLDIHLLSLMGETVRGSLNGTWMGKRAEMGMLVCSSKTRIIVIGIRGRHKND